MIFMNPHLVRVRTYVFILLLLLSYPLLLLLTEQRRLHKNNKRLRILIFPQLTRIGDLVCATPLFRALKEKYPDCFLAVAVGVAKDTAGIIRENPHVDEVIFLEPEEYTHFFGLFHFFKKVRKYRFDWGINIAASTMGTLTLIFSLMPQRIKIVRKERPLTELLTDWTNTFKILYKDGEHIPTLYLKTLRFLSVPLPPYVRKEVFPTDKGNKKAREFLNKHNIGGSDFIVGISVTAGNEIKEWENERFGKLAKHIAEEYGAKVLFIGAPYDREKLEKANQYSGSVGIVTVDFNIGELPSLLKQLDIFISSDSGPMHIAHALGVPLIDIIGPVDPNEQAPRDEKSIVVMPPKDIKPTIFAFKRPGDPRESRRASETITVRDVMKAFHTLCARIKTN